MLFMLPLSSLAQLMACRGFVEEGYDFWLYLPDSYEKAEELPLVMFLHGKSLSGDSLEMVLQYGSIHALFKGRAINAIVVAPQAQTAWEPKRVMALYDWLDDHYKVDTNRFYVIGMSMGGYGTLDVATEYPDRVAAAMAMCGGATGKELCGLSTLPLWIIHGTADKAVPVRCSDRVVDSIRSCGDTTRLIYDRLEDVNHSVWLACSISSRLTIGCFPIPLGTKDGLSIGHTLCRQTCWMLPTMTWTKSSQWISWRRFIPSSARERSIMWSRKAILWHLSRWKTTRRSPYCANLISLRRTPSCGVVERYG